jgi:hypothetical protein
MDELSHSISSWRVSHELFITLSIGVIASRHYFSTIRIGSMT